MITIDCLTTKLGCLSIVTYDKWNQEYEGMVLRIVDSNQLIRSRLAKKTPKKSGYFAVFWEKNQEGRNRPFDDQNFPDFLAIVIVDGDQQGFFMIPHDVAVEKKLLTSSKGQGKMALRFYPPWCMNLNKTALTTQKWQVDYFIDLTRKTN